MREQSAHADEFGLEHAIISPLDTGSAHRDQYIVPCGVETARQPHDAFIDGARGLRVDVDAEGVLGPIKGAQQTLHLVDVCSHTTQHTSHVNCETSRATSS